MSYQQTMCRVLLIGIAVSLLALPTPVAVGQTVIMIDNFDNNTPSPGVQNYYIDHYNPDPTHLEASGPQIIGSERDLLVDVTDPSTSTSASGEIGDGEYEFASIAPDTHATLQYDGVDSDTVGPPRALLNAEGLANVNLMISPNESENFFYLRFGLMKVPHSPFGMHLEIEAHSGDNTNKATYSGTIPDGTLKHKVAFSEFNKAGSASFGNITSLEFTFNNAGGGIQDVDFQIDFIKVVPEPSTLALLGVGVVLLVACRRFRRKR